MDDLALKLTEARNIRGQWLMVVVVPGPENDEARSVRLGLALMVNGQLPHIVGGRPVGRQQAMLEVNMLVDAVLRSCVAHIFGDGGALGDRGVLIPGVPREPKRKQIRVGSNAGIFEEIPGSANGVAGF